MLLACKISSKIYKIENNIDGSKNKDTIDISVQVDREILAKYCKMISSICGINLTMCTFIICMLCILFTTKLMLLWLFSLYSRCIYLYQKANSVIIVNIICTFYIIIQQIFKKVYYLCCITYFYCNIVLIYVHRISWILDQSKLN